MNRVSNTVEENFIEYEERNLVHTLLERPQRPLDLDAWSETLHLEVPRAEAISNEVRERRMFEIADSDTRVLVAGKKSQLPWWAALGSED